MFVGGGVEFVQQVLVCIWIVDGDVVVLVFECVGYQIGECGVVVLVVQVVQYYVGQWFGCYQVQLFIGVVWYGMQVQVLVWVVGGGGFECLC